MVTIEQQKNGVEALYAVSHWLLEQGKFRDAASILRTMVQVAPTDERGWLALGVCHEHADQPEVAIEMYGTGSALCHPSPRCQLARARLLRAAGDEAEAFEAYEAAAEAAAHDGELAELIDSERGEP